MTEGLRDISTEHGVITDGTDHGVITDGSVGFIIPAKKISVTIEGERD